MNLLDLDNVYIRKVTENDKDMMFEWTNDPETRKNSFSTEKIEYDEHCKWFEAMMNNENRIQYILMYKDFAVGQIRIDIDGTLAEISYSIAPAYRGRGYANKALGLIKDEVIEKYPSVDRLIGQVKPANIASAKAFLREGYQETYRQFEINIER